MTDRRQISGFINVDKPLGMTSHTVVARIRRGLGIKKVGHAGTLDPLATGVLVVCLGHATRLSEYAMSKTKVYRAHVHLGAQTTTYDAEGEITATGDIAHITADAIRAALPQFTGQIAQLPPLYSAVKQGGRKLYEVARAGGSVERKPRRVVIHALDLVSYEAPVAALEITCGPGTYIRSLAHDLGDVLGCGAYLAGLVRTRSGTFHIDEAVTLEAVLDSDDWTVHLLPMDTPLAELPALHLDDEDVDHVLHGRVPQHLAKPDPEAAGQARAYDPTGTFVALLRADGETWRPHKVFPN
ncbi:MAG: tRNA pseudouridine(55) synthase TruB [Chloroflexota bacterium]